jgi:stage III sporulation protein AF
MYWREWLQSLLGLVVLLGVLEMLLPSGELAKYSKLVLGLALMLAFLQPLTILLNQDVRDLDLSWISEGSICRNDRVANHYR